MERVEAMTSSLPSDGTLGLDELTERATTRIFERVIAVRRRLQLPFGLMFALVLWTGADLWRVGAIVLAMTFAVIVWRTGSVFRAEGRVSMERFGAATVVAGVIQTLLVFAFGGVAGPVLPAMAVLALVAALLGPARTSAILVLGVQIPALWLMAGAYAQGLVPDLVPAAWRGLWLPEGSGAGPWVMASFASFALFAAYTLGRVLRDVVLELVRESIEERDRTLAFHAEMAESMSLMSAEIAHELKNPLASIKGLAALVRKDLEGTPAERMDVLRREVDRMQGILEEFLAYSRPLVPLDESDVDLVELTREVADLHDGMAAQRGVAIARPDDGAEPIHLRCDPKKVRQVLINLVQNALDATPRGSTVTLVVTEKREGAELCVIDEGPGLTDEARAKLFEVGFTTKKQGTGLGLAVARGLARQHHGELTLENREGVRGCVATLVLPRERTVAAEVAA